MTIKFSTAMTFVFTLTALALTPATLCAQGISTAQQTQSTEIQAHGYWIDPSKGLMWAGRDNGEDVSWKGAMKHCRGLRLAGYSDWQLATLAQLESLYDAKAQSPGLMGAKLYHNVSPSTWHVRGGLFLTGDQWTSGKRLDDRGTPTAYAIYYDFNEGKSNNQPSGWPYRSDGMRALCVRTPQLSTAK